MARTKKEKVEPLEDKDKALEAGLSAIEKEYGKGSVVFGPNISFPEIERIPTGAISLDRALTGGYAKGRIIEIYGPESSGKTTLTLHAIAECQKKGGRCAFVDVEHAMDPEYAKALGVDMEKIVFSQPDSAEQALNITEMLVRTDALDLIVIDSVSALTPAKEIEGEIGDNVIGLQARLMSQAMRKLAGISHKTGTTIIFINQIRMKIGVMFGNPETTSGGNALKFYASQRLDVRRTGTISQGDDKTGITCKVKVVKSKVGKPFQLAEFNIKFGEGIDWAADLLNNAVIAGIVDKAGAWYSYNGERIGQGEKNATDTIRTTPGMADELQSKIL